jgi:CheY-like chemotaxis protein
MEKTPENRSADMPEGHETVLVVEDNDLVLELVVEMMKDLGYHVLTAIDAHSALWIIQHDERIQLLFTDVMMPDQMNGIDLPAHVTALALSHPPPQHRPELKVLLTSGYAGFDTSSGRSATEFPVLPKPYRRAELARRVRAALDAAA